MWLKSLGLFALTGVIWSTSASAHIPEQCNELWIKLKKERDYAVWHYRNVVLREAKLGKGNYRAFLFAVDSFYNAYADAEDTEDDLYDCIYLQHPK